MDTQVDGRGPSAPVRKPRCRMQDRRGNRCPNEAIEAGPNVIEICPAHALRAAQLLADHGAIRIAYAKTRRTA